MVGVLLPFYSLELRPNQSLFVSIIQLRLKCPLRPVSDIVPFLLLLAWLVDALVDRAITNRLRDPYFFRRRTQVSYHPVPKARI